MDENSSLNILCDANSYIDAFNKFWKKNKNSYLIIIGGHGNIYKKTCNYIKNVV